MKSIPSFVVLVLLSACSQQAPSPPASSPAPASAPPPVAPAAATGYEFAFGFRGGKETAADKRILRTQESPCGALPIARVTTMPLADAVLVADPVVEFDQAGKEIAHWGKPNGADVLALDGDRLQFSTGHDAYWTDTKGTIEKSAGAATPVAGGEFLTSAGMFACPTLPTFPETEGSQQCFRVHDAAGRERLIALEGVCS